MSASARVVDPRITRVEVHTMTMTVLSIKGGTGTYIEPLMRSHAIDGRRV